MSDAFVPHSGARILIFHHLRFTINLIPTIKVDLNVAPDLASELVLMSQIKRTRHSLKIGLYSERGQKFPLWGNEC